MRTIPSKADIAVIRRRRGWSSTVDGINTLQRSAFHIARVSARRISTPLAAECLSKYQYLTAVERAAKLVRGDLLVELIDSHRVRAIDIARQTGERPADLSQMYRTAKAFPPDRRPKGVPYNVLMMAAWMTRRFPELGMSPSAALAEIRKHGHSQHRDVTRHFAAMARQISRRSRVFAHETSPDPLLGSAHLCRFQELLGHFPGRSITILNIDPPYVYGGTATYRSRSARSTASDADHPVAAVELVVDVLRDWQPKLAQGGVVLLWQPWQSLLPEIVAAAKEYAWSVAGPVIWDKGRPQPGRFDSPYTPQGEMLWILSRAGDRLTNHDGGSRRMVLPFPPVSFPGQAEAQEHGFEKPVALCEHLIRKHSQPNGLVFDACGCTGSMSVAAINNGRRWVYAESHPENFRLGNARITDVLGRAPELSPLPTGGATPLGGGLPLRGHV